MSRVCEIHRLGAPINSLFQYINEFRQLLISARIQTAGDFFDPAADWLNEEAEIMVQWMFDTGKVWQIPSMRIHKLLGRRTVPYSKDWPPPGWYFLTVLAPSVALKQDNPRVVLECRLPGGPRGALFRRRIKSDLTGEERRQAAQEEVDELGDNLPY